MKSFHLLRNPLISLIFLGLSAAPGFAAPVDINSADAGALAESLSGVGPQTAAAIVAYRKEHGLFQTAEDLLKVKGIGPKTLERNREDILTGPKAREKGVK